LDRLGFSRPDILPGQGDPKADRLVAKDMGPLFEKIVVPFVESERYRGMTDQVRALMLQRLIQQVRRGAVTRAQSEDPALFARLRIGRIPKRERDVIESMPGNPIEELRK
jgi:hypothetical protein